MAWRYSGPDVGSAIITSCNNSWQVVHTFTCLCSQTVWFGTDQR